MPKFIITCGGCGTEHTRTYLPQILKCSACQEAYEVDTWREIPDQVNVMINLMFTPYALLDCPHFKNDGGACLSHGATDPNRDDVPTEGVMPSCPHFPKAFFEDDHNQLMMDVHRAFGTLCYRLGKNDAPLTEKCYKSEEK